MNNEEKILSALETLVLAVNSLAKGQTKLKTRFDKLEARVEDIHDNLAKLEIENEQAHGAIFDKLDILEGKFDSKLRKVKG
ncbi:MAG: hypothetical protein FWC55_09210 [Firmicutes bacterium]|nr:hypothetical protein [Bacillota bacterium]